MPPQRPVCAGRLVYAIRRRHDSNVPGIWPSPSVSNDHGALHRLAQTTMNMQKAGIAFKFWQIITIVY